MLLRNSSEHIDHFYYFAKSKIFAKYIGHRGLSAVCLSVWFFFNQIKVKVKVTTFVKIT